jgi:hypothetical protein
MSGDFSWKKGFVENLKKNQFLGVGRIVWALGADGPRVFDIYLISEFLEKVFEKNRLPGGQFAGLLRTVRYSLQNRTEQGAARWTERTVRGVLADGSPSPTASSASR